MSVRFIVIYIITLFLTTIYFLNVPTFGVLGKEFNLSDFWLTKTLNQSHVILLCGYLFVKFHKSINTIILLLFVYYALYFLEELIEPFCATKATYYYYNNIILILTIIIQIIISINQHSKFYVNAFNNKLFSILLIFVSLILIYWVSFYLMPHQLWLVSSEILLSACSIIVAFNRPDDEHKSYWYIAVWGIIMITIGNLEYCFHSNIKGLDFTFSWVRAINVIGELLFVIAILKGANIPKVKHNHTPMI